VRERQVYLVCLVSPANPVSLAPRTKQPNKPDEPKKPATDELPQKFRLPRVMYNRRHHERKDEMKIPKQAYTAELKELAVTRVKDGLTAGAVAKELGLIVQTLRNWVKAAAAGGLSGAGAKVVTLEQMELSRLRAKNMRLGERTTS
jgi:transposase